MIGDLLPRTVSFVEEFGDRDDVVLFPVEAALIAKAVEKRRREFTTTRSCAREALASIGFAPSAIVTGLRGAPRWPAGVVGSMTHCDGYRAAAVAHDRDIATVGIDAEPHDRLPDGVLASISLPEERSWIHGLSTTQPGVHWDRLLFSAKESVYKAWFPLTLRWLDFEEANIQLRLDGTFTATLLTPGPVVAAGRIDGFLGRWLVRDGIAVTAITVAAGTAPTTTYRDGI